MQGLNAVGMPVRDYGSRFQVEYWIPFTMYLRPIKLLLNAILRSYWHAPIDTKKKVLLWRIYQVIGIRRLFS